MSDIPVVCFCLNSFYSFSFSSFLSSFTKLCMLSLRDEKNGGVELLHSTAGLYFLSFWRVTLDKIMI